MWQFFSLSLCSTLSVFCTEKMNHKDCNVLLKMFHMLHPPTLRLLVSDFNLAFVDEMHTQMQKCSFECISYRLSYAETTDKRLAAHGVLVSIFSHVHTGWFAGCPIVLPLIETTARGVTDWSTFLWQRCDTKTIFCHQRDVHSDRHGWHQLPKTSK